MKSNGVYEQFFPNTTKRANMTELVKRIKEKRRLAKLRRKWPSFAKLDEELREAEDSYLHQGIALELLREEQPDITAHITQMRDRLEEGIQSSLDNVLVNGEGSRIGNTSNILDVNNIPITRNSITFTLPIRNIRISSR